MSKNKLVRTADSPILLVYLLSLAAVLAAAFYRGASASAAPPISGWSWAQHPDTLLVAVPPGECGCGLPLLEWIREGADHKLHVLIVASRDEGEVAILRKAKLSTRRVSILANVSASTIKQLAPGDQVTATLVRGGHVVSRLRGGLPPADFFQ